MTEDVTGYKIVHRDEPTMYFFGVTTSRSAIMRVFPVWAEILRLDRAQLIGVDLPLHADAELYRKAVAQIKYDGLSLGALVTTHKIDVLEAAADMFDEFDKYARLCGDLSCISKQENRLIGHAKDPIAAGSSLQHILEPGYWERTGGHVLCIGAGGSAISIAYYLMARPDPGDRPKRIVVVNRSQPRLDKLRAIVAGLPPTIDVEYILNEDPVRNDKIMSDLPAGSMVINATGMGKDRPGSPITDDGVFPTRGIAWELNYRGELDFMHQAMAQERQRNLTIHDGWQYFLYGWSGHIAEVFHKEITDDLFDQLAKAAEVIRPSPDSR